MTFLSSSSSCTTVDAVVNPPPLPLPTTTTTTTAAPSNQQQEEHEQSPTTTTTLTTAAAATTTTRSSSKRAETTSSFFSLLSSHLLFIVSCLHQYWITCTNTIRYYMIQCIVIITRIAAMYPISTVLLLLTTSMSLIIIGLFYSNNFKLELDLMTIFTPATSKTIGHREWALHLSNLPGYSLSYVPIQIIIHANGHDVFMSYNDDNNDNNNKNNDQNKNNNNNNKDIIQHVFDVYNVATSSPEYYNLCSTTKHAVSVFNNGQYEECNVHSITRLWNHNETLYQQQQSISSISDILLHSNRTQYPDNTTIDLDKIMGMKEILYHTTDNDSKNNRQQRRPAEQSTTSTSTISAESLFVEITIPLSRLGTMERLLNYTNVLMKDIAILQKTWDRQQQQNNDNNNKSQQEYHVEFAFNFNPEQEFKETIFSDFPLLPIVFIVMVSFTCFIFWKYNDMIQSRLLLALGSVITVVLSIGTGFGFMFCLGIPYTVVTNVLPYIIFGVGLDDTYIIHGAYIRTNVNKTVLLRIRDTFEEIGISIIMTTITTAIAFAIGCYSTTVPAIQYLCLYAFPTILIDFIYQITFFVALIVLDEKRIQAKRKDCCFCIVVVNDDDDDDDVDECNNDSDCDSNKHINDNNSNRTAQNHCISSETKCDNDSDNDNVNDANQNAAIQRSTATVSNNNIFLEQNNDGNGNNDNERQSPGQRFMSWYADQLLHPRVKICVLITFAALLAGCAYSATLIRQQFSFYDLLRDDSTTKAYMEAKEKYGGINGQVYLYFRGMNQSNAEVQDQMIDFVDQIAATDHMELQPFCWVRDMRALMDDPYAFVDTLMTDPATARIIEGYPEVTEFLHEYAPFVQNLTFNELLDLAFSQPMIGALYGVHMRRNDTTGDVYASRCQVMIRNLDYNSVQDSVKLLHAQNEVTMNHPINQNRDIDHQNAFLYKDLFHLWEFFDVAIHELRFTAVTGILTVTALGFFFIPHWSGIFYIFPLMCILYVNLLGLFQLAGLSINVLTYVVLVVSVGLLVDFIMHIILRYYESTKMTRNEKVKETLETMGASILLGGVSTFLGTVPLIFSKSAVFRTMCTAFFSMIGLGISHGLILLPVLLSMFGTVSTTSNTTSIIVSNVHHNNKKGKAEDTASESSGSGAMLTSSEASSVSQPSEENNDLLLNEECTLAENSSRIIKCGSSAVDYNNMYTIKQMGKSIDTFDQFEIVRWPSDEWFWV